MTFSAESIALLRASAVFDGVNDEQVSQIDAHLQPVSFAAGEAIVRVGEPADRWYVIADGSAAVTHTDLAGEQVTLALLGPGDSFGERALFADRQPRLATVSAVTPSTCFALESSDFEQLARQTPEVAERITRRLDVMTIDTALKRASPFASLGRVALWSLAQLLESRRATTGEMIIRQGEPGDCFYLIRSGSVAVTKGKRRVAILRAGDSFGEVALLTRAPRIASVTALEDTELLSLTRDAFQTVALEHASVASYFRELIGVRFRGAAGQHVLLPDPLSSIMPLLGTRRRKRYWLVLLIGVFVFGVLTVAAQTTDSPTALYAVMAVGSLIGPVVFVLYLAESNILTERPLELIVTAILGAALGLPPAIALQREAGIIPGTIVSALLVAAIEEPAKVLGVVWLLRRPALRFRMDGVIFGAAAGMGFAAIETGMYAFARVETVGALVGMLWLRALLSPFTHGTWTAIVCATIWRERAAGWWRGGIRIASAFAAVVLLHGLWDWRGLSLPWNFLWLMLVGVVSVLTLRAILQRAAREEARSVAALAPEIARATPTSVRLECDGCGSHAPAGARYCPRCGLALRRSSKPQRASQSA